ncbi:hypothetical protein K470DRAFT_265241 [Piedraia hortae CBS 480.64]|uniref:Uncharacterized protein n=1 Tax=Piedraia hortae CBS 480.64 TaxID=1314780 RepID=A0A6A7BWZ7_9PEZI|nr:hypothetical protein K470DRAFT_265241 [Piedraia hortae CBS 480.64]
MPGPEVEVHSNTKISPPKPPWPHLSDTGPSYFPFPPFPPPPPWRYTPSLPRNPSPSPPSSARTITHQKTPPHLTPKPPPSQPHLNPSLPPATQTGSGNATSAHESTDWAQPAVFSTTATASAPAHSHLHPQPQWENSGAKGARQIKPAPANSTMKGGLNTDSGGGASNRGRETIAGEVVIFPCNVNMGKVSLVMEEEEVEAKPLKVRGKTFG